MKTLILKALNKLNELLVILIQSIEIRVIRDHALNKGLDTFLVETQGSGLLERRIIVQSSDGIGIVFSHRVTGRTDLVINRINRRFKL